MVHLVVSRVTQQMSTPADDAPDIRQYLQAAIAADIL